MKRIFFVCVEGFAKAKMDGDGFFGTQIFIIWEIFKILAFVLEIVLVLEIVFGTQILMIGKIFEILIREKFLKFWNADDSDFTDSHGFFN